MPSAPDPDVPLVGETRDLETAKTAIEGLTGHLVLSTLHANDAPAPLPGSMKWALNCSWLRLSDGIISQRLLRRICGRRKPYKPDERELGRFGLMASREANVTFFKAHHHKEGEPVCPTVAVDAGRLGVYEVLRINEEMAMAISKGSTTDVVRQLALEQGCDLLGTA